jgi:hypothetical protein
MGAVEMSSPRDGGALLDDDDDDDDDDGASPTMLAMSFVGVFGG